MKKCIFCIRFSLKLNSKKELGYENRMLVKQVKGTDREKNCIQQVSSTVCSKEIEN
jgi:hypothetical protein